MMTVLVAVARAVAGRMLLAAVFGAIAYLLAQQVAGKLVEQMGSGPQTTSVPSVPAPSSAP